MPFFPGPNSTMIQYFEGFLLECFKKIQQENPDNVKEALGNRRVQIATMLAPGLAVNGGDVRFTQSALVMEDVFCEMLLDLPSRNLQGDAGIGFVERVINESNLLIGISSLYSAPGRKATTKGSVST